MQGDKKLIVRLKAGDVAAFDAIYHSCSKKIFHFALGLVKDQDISKDIVQETFVHLWEKRSQVNENLNFDNYLFTIAYNSIRKYFRKKSIETKSIDHLLRNSPENIDNIEGDMIYNELLALANKAIEKLPSKRKTVFKLSKQEGMKIKEIANQLNISTRTAEGHLAKALKYLKKELAEI